MPEGPEYNVQRFQWRMLREFSDLLNKLGRHGFRSWPESPDELRSELETLRMDAEADIALLGGPDGHTCGYVLTLPEPDIDRIVVSLASTDSCETATNLLVDFALARAVAMNVSLVDVAIRGVPVERLELLKNSGFEPVAAHVELTLQRDDARNIEDSPLPEGFSIRSMRSSAETLLLTQIQNGVFEGQWGFSKNTPEEIQSRLELPVTDPEHVLFIEDPEGDIAGYIWTALEWHDDHTCGKVWMTGVLPNFRGLGLGKAVVNAGIKHLLAEGAADVHLEVVEDNAAAVRIYERFGFERHGRTIWYEKRV